MSKQVYVGEHTTPVNLQARLVVSRGVKHDSTKNVAQRHWSIPPKTIPLGRRDADLVGKKFGNFTVVGKFSKGKDKGNKEARWLVKCTCGDFETRRARSILNPNNKDDCCENCRHLKYLKHKISLSKSPDSNSNH